MEESSASSELLNSITLFKERAEAAAIAAEAANSKANSESAFAYNAKQNAEDHAKAISQVRGIIDAEFAGLATTKKNAEEAANIVAAAKATTDANAQAVAEKKAQIEKDAAAARATSEKGAAALAVIEKAQADMTSALKEVNSGAASIAAAKTNADTAVVAIQALQEQMVSLGAKTKIEAEAITKFEADSKSLFNNLNKVVQTAQQAQGKVTEYEKKLTELTADYVKLDQKIEGLLPNATSAGLASAFRNQKERFKKPQKYWLLTFVITIILLLVVEKVGAFLGIEKVVVPDTGTSDSWDAIFRHLMARLPLIIPLVWLGIYAGRNYMLALRVEEEYAFKEAVSTAFEGYKREMADISAGSGSNDAPPINVLCENVLRALSQRPGRIYEGRHEDITPLSPVRGMFGMKRPESTAKAPAAE